MLIRSMIATVAVFVVVPSSIAQENPMSQPIELEVLKASVGVWDAEFEVWPRGPDSPSIKFKGVETNRPFGEYWIASDLVSEYEGQTTKVHSIIGYDLDQGELVGKIIDHGPYAAKLTGDYDQKSKTVQWTTEGKGLDGKPLLQRTSVTHKNADERVLVLTVPGRKKDEFIKFMQIRFVKRK